jgi:predicted enzyme related to lactoylglutathione lyase
VEFYRDVLALPLSYIDEELGWAQFDLNTIDLALERCDAKEPECAELVGRFVGLSIEVEDIYLVYEDLSRKGVEFVGPPEKQPWGGILAHFKDPDKNVLTLLGSSAT